MADTKYHSPFMGSVTATQQLNLSILCFKRLHEHAGRKHLK